MKAHAGHVIASALLRTYLGEQTGQRVHAGAIERGSVESLHAVLWFADIRGFTPTSDASPGPIVIELLNDVFEVIGATLRSRGGEVLKISRRRGAGNLILQRGGSRKDMPLRA